MAAATNNSANVSTTKFVQGGYMFVAPKGTVCPTDITSKLGDAFANVGYISEDGFTESVDSDSNDYLDANQDIADSDMGAITETVVAKLIEFNETALGVQYGSKNVSTGEDGTITVDHNWSKSSEEIAVVFELVLKNGRRWRKVIPSATLSEIGEFVGSRSEVAGREVTLKYLADAQGSTAKDYIAAAVTGSDE